MMRTASCRTATGSGIRLASSGDVRTIVEASTQAWGWRPAVDAGRRSRWRCPSWLRLLAGAAAKRSAWAIALGLCERHDPRARRRSDRTPQGPGDQDTDVPNQLRILDDNQVLRLTRRRALRDVDESRQPSILFGSCHGHRKPEVAGT